MNIIMSLTADQKIVYDNYISFLNNPYKNIFILCGSAGTGKSFLTKYFSKNIDNVCGIAPTHKAKYILSSMLNSKRIKEITTYTIASILNKMKDHSFIGTHKYTSGDNKKLSSYNIFILDEVSMVSDEDLKFFISYVSNNNKKLVVIGDPYQIPCPSQPIINKGEYCQKAECMLFENSNDSEDSEISGISEKYMLNEIVRQAQDSPIIKIATFLRDNITEDKLLISNPLLVDLLLNRENYLEDFLDNYKLYPYTTRFIAYTNASISDYNKHIRKALKYGHLFVKGELLTAYTTIGFPIPYIVNGTDYVVISQSYTKIHKLNGQLCSGYLLRLKILETYCESPELFFIDINDESNFEILNQLISLALVVNSKNSSKEDYKKYKTLKDKMIFCEDLYKYDKITSKTDFKMNHPLLFTKTSDVLDSSYNVINPSCKLINNINSIYPSLLQERQHDSKQIGDSETLSDRYMIIEKDMDYGYALTAHKSQGSTYDVVYVDLCDFNKITNRYNNKFKKIENRTKEKNQLLYVALTRARKTLRILNS